MLLSIVIFPKNTDFNKKREKILSNIDKVKRRSPLIKEYIYNVYGEPESTYTLDKIKEEFKEIVTKTFESLEYRDVIKINHKGDSLFISGGMSWGDYPTESSEWFYKFDMLPSSLKR